MKGGEYILMKKLFMLFVMLIAVTGLMLISACDRVEFYRTGQKPATESGGYGSDDSESGGYGSDDSESGGYGSDDSESGGYGGSESGGYGGR